MSAPGRPHALPGLLGVAERGLVLLAAAVAALLGLLAQMTPLGLPPGAWPAPDLVFCALAWTAVVRPDALPAWAVFALALIRDFVTGGPVGAEALALALSVEGLKAHARFQDRPALRADAMALAAAAAAALLLPWLLMKLSFAGGPPLTDLPPRWLATMAALPVVALLLRFGLRIRRPAPTGERGR